jgi:chitinase
MKKFLIYLLPTILLLANCTKKDHIPEPENGGLLDKVEGRVVGASVTFYEQSTPDPAYFTHLFYAFAEIYMDNGQYKGFKVEGSESRFTQIAALKVKYPHLKISISFANNIENADNKLDGGFSTLAKSDQYRKAFALDCKAFLQKWGIDGVDMDWEFPGLGWSGAVYDVAVDVANHVLLMKQLRETLGNSYLLTYAGYCMDKQPTSGGSRYIDIAAVAPYIDWVNIMTYDLDEAPRHHSALSDSRAYRDCQRAVNAYLQAGMPANKLVLGIPFYGRRSFSTAPLALSYKTILTLNPQSYKIDNWDAVASVPYVTYNGLFYCGYDNAKSITVKGEWLLKLGMKGMMYWQYDQDDNAFTLRKAVWNSVMKK